ncbi:MAG: prolyl oligopeptidase family serine peptidase [Deltaproteobacteria bacterium]|nr:prolyl oligopeptidase family serine peptidase [Deltaproteobacteria bacterium]
MIARLQAEADAVLAAVEYLRSVPSADISRLGIAGRSLGGIVTLFAISRNRSFRAAVDTAGGLLVRSFSPALQAALRQAARAVTCLVLLMDAQNDRPRGDTDALRGEGRRGVTAPADHVSAVYAKKSRLARARE